MRITDIAMITVARGTGEAMADGVARRPRRAAIEGWRLYQVPT